MDLPLVQNNKQWKLIAKSKLKWYNVHADNHSIKAFRDEQALMLRNDRLKVPSFAVYKQTAMFIY